MAYTTRSPRLLRMAAMLEERFTLQQGKCTRMNFGQPPRDDCSKDKSEAAWISAILVPVSDAIYVLLIECPEHRLTF